MKILFLTDNFPPEITAPSFRTYEHCKEWVKNGAEVTVLTSFPNFPFGKPFEGYKNSRIRKEEMDGMTVIRVWTFMAPNTGFIIRTLDFMSYSVSSFLAGLTIKCDLIVATSPQFFTAIAGRKLAFFKRKPWVFEVRDMWPEQVLASTNVKRNWLIRYFEWQELRCYKSADLIVPVTESFVKKISARGIPDEKFLVVRNGTNDQLFYPREKDLELLQQLDIEDKKVIGYIGTHGMSQNLQFIIKAINELKRDDIHFLFVGEGSEKAEMRAMTETMSLTNVTFLDQVKKEEVTRYMSVLDIALVPLRRTELYKSVIPSKIFDCAAMEVPILLGVDGESREIVEKHNAGVFFEPEDQASFSSALERLLDPELRKEVKKGCKALAADFSRSALARKMLKGLQQIQNR